MNKILIGIDPDIDKSGVAFKDGANIELSNLTFFQLFNYLDFVKKQQIETTKVTVYVECGFLNKSNWHKIANGSASVNAKIGGYVGANHHVAKMIVEMCKYLDLECIQVRPTATKIKADYFKSVTGITTRTNQEQRDALMLIFGRN